MEGRYRRDKGKEKEGREIGLKLKCILGERRKGDKDRKEIKERKKG
jgi:hypothetical protein